jgi:alanine racemase
MTQPFAPRVLRPRRAAPADAVRPTRAEINLEALRHNLRVVRRHAEGARVWAVLKADAYGHGAPAVARTLERARVDGFCVALLEEAVELREAGIVAPILVMGGHYGSACDEVVARGLIPVIHDVGQVAAFGRLVRSGMAKGPVEVHVKVDTGMARLGVTMQALPELAAALADFPEVRARGLMTHLACADAPTNAETQEQMARFQEARTLLAKHGILPEVLHAANSAAVLRGQARLDVVRPGLALFGVSPLVEGTRLTDELWPVMRVRTEVVALRDLPAGEPVGYGYTWRSSVPSKIATLPMGYADGLSRQLGRNGDEHGQRGGYVLIRGVRAPIVGAVSMDMTMVDVTAVPGVDLRDEAVVLGGAEGFDRRTTSSTGGPSERDAIDVDEIALQTGAIAWEVLTGFSRRVPRFYREP